MCVCPARVCASVLCAVRNAADAGAGALRAPFHNQYRRRRRAGRQRSARLGVPSYLLTSLRPFRCSISDAGAPFVCARCRRHRHNSIYSHPRAPYTRTIYTYVYAFIHTHTHIFNICIYVSFPYISATYIFSADYYILSRTAFSVFLYSSNTPTYIYKVTR